MVVGSKTLRMLVAEADVVVHARVEARRGVAARTVEGGAADRPSVEAAVIEVLKGDPGGERVRFVQHGHGVATFEPGREHVLFLLDLRRSRELDALAESNAYRWVSVQEHDEAHRVEPPVGAVLLDATRAYASAGTAPNATERAARLRVATLGLLGSGDPGLAASAIRDLVAAPEQALVSEADTPALLAIVDDRSTSIGVRVALLRQLEGRGLHDGHDRWLALLRDEAPTAERVAAIRAAAPDPRPAIRARLIVLLASEREIVAAAAADALGRRGDAAAVPPLDQALGHTSGRVRQAAVRGLGRTATPEALAVLDRAGNSHPDPTTRRLAAAEARKRRAR